jgi:hypothetical protein
LCSYVITETEASAMRHIFHTNTVLTLQSYAVK